MSYQRYLLRLFYICLVANLAFIHPANAATQGKLGKTSSGSFTITLVIRPKLDAQIATTSEQPSGSVSTIARFNQKEPVCVKGKGIDNYTLTAEGSGSNGEFTLTSGAQSLTYDVDLWTTPASHEEMVSGQASNSIPSTPANQDCTTQGAKIAVIPQQPLNDKNSLNGILNLTVSAE